MRYAIVSSTTGELEDDCGVCALGSMTDPENMEAFELDEGHKIIELTDDEFDELERSIGYAVERPDPVKGTKRVVTGEYPHDAGAIPTPVYTKRVDVGNAARRLAERPKSGKGPVRVVVNRKI